MLCKRGSSDQRPLLSVLGTVCTGLLFISHTLLQFFYKTPPWPSSSHRTLLIHSFFFFNSHEVPNYSSSMSIAVVSSVLNITFHIDNYRYSGIDMFYGCKIFKTKHNIIRKMETLKKSYMTFNIHPYLM